MRGHACTHPTIDRGRRTVACPGRADRPRPRHQDHRSRGVRSRPQARHRRRDRRPHRLQGRRGAADRTGRPAQYQWFCAWPADQHGWQRGPAGTIDPRLRAQFCAAHRAADRAVGRAAVDLGGGARADCQRRQPRQARQGHRRARGDLHLAGRSGPAGRAVAIAEHSLQATGVSRTRCGIPVPLRRAGIRSRHHRARALRRATPPTTRRSAPRPGNECNRPLVTNARPARCFAPWRQDC